VAQTLQHAEPSSVGWVVLGVEGQFDWLANQNNSSAGIAVPNLVTGGTDIISVVSKDRWLTTLIGRVGVAADHWLFYAKGGGAWVGNQSFTVNDATTPGASFTTSSGGWNSGWTVGGGIEWAFAGPWSVKLEYDYVRLSAKSFTVPATSPFLPNDVFTTANRNIQAALFGVNYRSGPGENSANLRRPIAPRLSQRFLTAALDEVGG
jgi:outer membrane immunogenic protein